MRFLLKLLIILFTFSSISHAEVTKFENLVDNFDSGKVRILHSLYEDKNGQKKLILGAHFRLKKGWKIYSQGSESVGLVPSIKIDKVKNHNIIWPKAIKKEDKIGDLVLKYSIYKDEVILPVEVDLKSYKKGQNLKINLEYGVCKDVCIPAEAKFNIVLSDEIDSKSLNSIQKYLPNKKIINSDESGSSQDNMTSIALVSGLFAAFIGGLILNIMPCVLPVLGVKLISVINHQDSKISRIRFSFISTILGILSSFIIFSFFAISVAKAGEVFNWGVQFQNPYFLIFLIMILVFFAANMLGFFEITFSQFLTNFLSKKIDKNKDKNIFMPNFLSGVLAVLLATPCSAPFLGAAISFSITQKSFVIFLIFLAMAIGFAFPYFILLIWPKAVNLLPKSGGWMLKVKKIMAGFLIATIIWLIYVLNGNIGFLPAILVAFSVALIFLTFKIKYKFLRYLSFMTLIVFAICVPSKISDIVHISRHKADMVWIKFDQSKIDEYVSEGKTVVIDVTADWCLTCKFNKYRVLRQDSVVKILKSDNIVAMRADITKPNPKVMDFVNSHNRFAIPFNVVYGPNAKEGLLASELLNKKDFLQLIKQASK